MAGDRPTPPRQRLEVTLHASAASRTDLAVHLMQLATELATDDGPDSVDRYTGTADATSHLVIDCDPSITPESYTEALRVWARETLRTHPRADHRAAALDPMEPF